MPTLSKCQLYLSSFLFSVHHQWGEELHVSLCQLLLVNLSPGVMWRGPPWEPPFRVPMIGFQLYPFSGCVWKGAHLALAPGAWPFFPSTWSSEPGLCSTQSLNLVLIGLRGAAACSIQLKPRGEIYCWDAGTSHGPWGQEVQLAGNQEWGSLEPSCVYFPSGAADVSSRLPPQTSFLCSVCTQGRRRLPLPRSETLLSLNVQHQEQAPLCPNYKCPEEKQIGPASSDAHLCPCTEEQGWG